MFGNGNGKITEAVSGTLQILAQACGTDNDIGATLAQSKVKTKGGHVTVTFEGGKAPSEARRVLEAVSRRALRDVDISDREAKIKKPSQGYQLVFDVPGGKAKPFVSALKQIGKRITDSPRLREQYRRGAEFSLNTVRLIPGANAYLPLGGIPEAPGEEQQVYLRINGLPPVVVQMMGAIVADEEATKRMVLSEGREDPSRLDVLIPLGDAFADKALKGIDVAARAQAKLAAERLSRSHGADIAKPDPSQKRTMGDATGECLKALKDACQDPALRSGFRHALVPPTAPQTYSIVFLDKGDGNKNVPPMLGRLLDSIFRDAIQDANIEIPHDALSRRPFQDQIGTGYKVTITLQPAEQERFIAALDAITGQIKSNPALQEQFDHASKLAMYTVDNMSKAKTYIKMIDAEKGNPHVLLHIDALSEGFMATLKRIFASDEKGAHLVRQIRNQELLGRHYFSIPLGDGEFTNTLEAKFRDAVGIYTREHDGFGQSGPVR